MTYRLRHRVLVASASALAAVASVVGFSAAPAHADPVPGITAYMWGYQPTAASYTIPITSHGSGYTTYYYAANDGNGQITVTRSGAGMYTVRYGGLGALLTGGGGVAHATAYGPTSNFCTVGYWYPSGVDLLVGVYCFNAAGARADSMFVTNFDEDSSTSFTGASYLWADQPTASSYVPSAWYRWDGSGGAAWVVRDSVGNYRVHLPASAGAGQTLFYQTTAYGSSAVICKVAAYISGDATRVECRTPSGAFVDSRFTISFSYWDMLQRIAPTDIVRVSDAYPSGGTASVAWTNITDGPRPSVTRTSTGTYQVIFPQIANPLSHAVAYAIGYQDARCHIVSWYQINTADVLGNVTCANSAGSPVNTTFLAGLTW